MQQSTSTAPAIEQVIHSVEQTTCCIVGGGPAGLVLAYMLARKDIPVTLLEAHMDFDRDFRGDTIHPSVMNIMSELGLAERLLQIPHAEMHRLSGQLGGKTIVIADFRRLKTRYPYIAMIPQVDFLNFIAQEAKQFPAFHLVMGAQVDELIEEHGRVRGVRYRGHDGTRYELRAVLTIGADGRFSRLRKLAGFEPIKTSPPMDVLWFRLSRHAGDPQEPFGRIANGRVLVLLNRHDYWQGGYIIPKGTYQQIRAAGLERFRLSIADTVPLLADRVSEIKEWKQVSVLSVESSRVVRWYRPGLLLIGDAAHVMSPVGGAGINYAIQDAVVAANVLSPRLKYGIVETRDLAKVQRRRELPTRLIQTLQNFLQKQVLERTFTSRRSLSLSPLVYLLTLMPGIRNIPALLVGFGLWPPHVRD
ncbi:MAG: FAD-dependent oxidoreductase [Ktedonobacteraceae bacterium]|nr:FAD-dependent oxidoreductase [Ktedonobacteraceae bacterium]